MTQGSKNGTEIFFLKWALVKMAEISILRVSGYFTCLNLIFVKILGNFQLGHHYYCLTVTGHMLAMTSSNEYAKWFTLDITILSTFTIHDDMISLITSSTTDPWFLSIL